MYGPEGDVMNRENNLAAYGFDRWGHYMFPSIHRLREGHLLVRVYVGGDGDGRYTKAHEYLNYLSNPSGKEWQHLATLDQGAGRPISDIATLLSNGEEIRFQSREVSVDAGVIKAHAGNYYRLGDLPLKARSIPLFTRKSKQEFWTETSAQWDPQTLLLGTAEEVTEGGRTRPVIRFNLSGPPPITHGFLRSDPWAAGLLVERADGSILVTLDADPRLRPMSDLGADGSFVPQPENYVWKSMDRGRTWTFAASIPASVYGTFFQTRRAHLEPRFSNGDWLAFYRTGGMYCSGGGPLLMRRSSDEGKNWSEAKPIRPCSAGIVTGLMLANGVAVRAYGRPRVFLMFSADGRGENWGNDITLVKPWKNSFEEKSCCNPNFVATGPDRFVFVYSRFDTLDPWGKPRQAVIAQEFVVAKKIK